MNRHEKAKKLHDTVSFVGLRAQATAVGLVQLVAELRRADILSNEAVDRIKTAIAHDINVSRASTRNRTQFEAMVQRRLDILFAPQDTEDARTPFVGDSEDGQSALGLPDNDCDD